MALKKCKCCKSYCFLSDVDDSCLINKHTIFGFCSEYYPKIKVTDDSIFPHLFHHHNLKTRKYSVIAIIISTISTIFASYAIWSSNSFNKEIMSKLNNVFDIILNIKNHIIKA